MGRRRDLREAGRGHEAVRRPPAAAPHHHHKQVRVGIMGSVFLMKAKDRGKPDFLFQWVNSTDIHFGPKIGPRYQIENWQIGRPRQAYAHWQNLSEFWPENCPDIFYVN